MPTSGGALRVEAPWAGSSSITRQIDVNVTGTLWGGWLVQTYDYEVADPNANRTSLAVGAAQGETPAEPTLEEAGNINSPVARAHSSAW